MRETRAAVYARVACATQQAKHATMSQLEALRDHAASSGMKIVEEFTDEGYSGLRLDRPGLERMRDLAERRGNPLYPSSVNSSTIFIPLLAAWSLKASSWDMVA